jgi:hypothetical protein
LKRWTGEDVSETCLCASRIQRMDRWGPGKCRRRIADITQWLRSEAEERNWWRRLAKIPGAISSIRMMVLMAIRRAEKDGHR